MDYHKSYHYELPLNVPSEVEKDPDWKRITSEYALPMFYSFSIGMDVMIVVLCIGTMVDAGRLSDNTSSDSILITSYIILAIVLLHIVYMSYVLLNRVGMGNTSFLNFVEAEEPFYDGEYFIPPLRPIQKV